MLLISPIHHRQHTHCWPLNHSSHHVRRQPTSMYTSTSRDRHHDRYTSPWPAANSNLSINRCTKSTARPLTAGVPTAYTGWVGILSAHNCTNPNSPPTKGWCTVCTHRVGGHHTITAPIATARTSRARASIIISGVDMALWLPADDWTVTLESVGTITTTTTMMMTTTWLAASSPPAPTTPCRPAHCRHRPHCHPPNLHPDSQLNRVQAPTHTHTHKFAQWYWFYCPDAV